MSELPIRRNINKGCLAFFILFCLPFLLVSETGRLSLTYQNQMFKTLNQNASYFTSLNSIYLNLWQELGRGSTFHSSINYYFDRENSQVASYNLGIQDIPLGKFKMDVDFGTISYPISSLSYFGSFNPTIYRGVKGGKITLRSNKTDLILFGGQLSSEFGIATQTEKSKLYGARAVFRPNRRWTVGTGWMKILDLASNDLSGNKTDYDIFSLDSSIMTFKNLYLLGDFRYIIDQSKKNKGSYSVKTGTYYNKGKVSFEIIYNYISSDYPNLGNIFSQDRKGVTVSGQYRPVYWLTLLAGLDTFNEQMKGILGQSLGNFLTYRFGSTFSPKSLPQFTASYNKSIKEFPGEVTVGSGSKPGTDFDMLFLSLSQQYRRFYWRVYYNNGTFTNSRDAAGNYRINRFILDLRWFYPTGHYLYLTGTMDQSTRPATALDNKNLNFQLGANLRMSSYFQLNFQGDYSIDKYAGTEGKNQRLGGGGGIIYRFKPLKINCAFRYQYAKTDASQLGVPVQYSHQAFLSITRDFKWGSEITTRGPDGRAVARAGKIKGRVFVDINQNDQQDTGEDGLQDIFILVDNHPEAKTDKNGRFTLTSLTTGVHQISLDLRNIPAFYEAAREKTEIILKKGQSGEIYLTVIPVGLLSGKIILDLNENGTPDKNEPLLSDIRVNLLKDNKLLRWEFTNSKGVFTFDNLRPGTYTVKVDEEGVYEKYNGLDKAAIEITVKPWEEKKDLLLLLNVYKKERVKKVLEY